MLSADEARAITRKAREEKDIKKAVFSQIRREAKKGKSLARCTVDSEVNDYTRAKIIARDLRKLGYRVRAEYGHMVVTLNIRWGKP